jgi:signal transduction histidine kinase
LGRIWVRFLFILLSLAVVSLIAWPIGGPITAMAVFATGLLAMVAVHYWHIAALRRWLRDPVPDHVPEGWGVWDLIFADLYRMLRRQRQSESRLTATLEDFQQAGAAMPDGMVILDAQDRIEWCNPVAAEHFGLDGQRDRGLSITNLVRQPQFVEYLQGQNFSEPLVLRQSRGPDFILSVQLVPYGAQQKLMISRDITDLERVETMRRDFIANVSHELRTPLTVVGGFLETILDLKGADNELVRRSLPLMMDQANRMRRLVEDLLTLSRLESSHNPPREEPVNVPNLARALYHDALALSVGRHRIVLDLRGLAHSERGGIAQRLHQPHQQRGALHPRGRRDSHQLEASHARSGVRGAGHRHRRRVAAHPAAHRAFLPRRSQPLARDRRHRPGARHREARAGPPPGPTRDHKRAGTGQYVQCGVPGATAVRGAGERAARAQGLRISDCDQ